MWEVALYQSLVVRPDSTNFLQGHVYRHNHVVAPPLDLQRHVEFKSLKVTFVMAHGSAVEFHVSKVVDATKHQKRPVGWGEGFGEIEVSFEPYTPIEIRKALQVPV